MCVVFLLFAGARFNLGRFGHSESPGHSENQADDDLSPKSKSTLDKASPAIIAEEKASPADSASHEGTPADVSPNSMSTLDTEDKAIVADTPDDKASPAHAADDEASLADNAEPKASPASLRRCSCSSGPKGVCSLHRCSCKECRKGMGKKNCIWRRRHSQWMKGQCITRAKLLKSQYCFGDDPLPQYHCCGVGSSTLPARESSLVELLWCNSSKSNLMVADISQSLLLGGVRWDGVVPTIACTGKMWVFFWGRVLTANELAALMGFGDDRLSSTSWRSVPVSQQRRMIGNSMSIHCVMAAIALAMRSFTEGSRNSGPSSSSSRLEQVKRLRVR